MNTYKIHNNLNRTLSQWSVSFLGLRKKMKGYKLWDLTSYKVIINKNVLFDEDWMIKLGCSKEEKVQGKVDERTIVQVELVDMVISL